MIVCDGKHKAAMQGTREKVPPIQWTCREPATDSVTSSRSCWWFPNPNRNLMLKFVKVNPNDFGSNSRKNDHFDNKKTLDTVCNSWPGPGPWTEKSSKGLRQFGAYGWQPGAGIRIRINVKYSTQVVAVQTTFYCTVLNMYVKVWK